VIQAEKPISWAGMSVIPRISKGSGREKIDLWRTPHRPSILRPARPFMVGDGIEKGRVEIEALSSLSKRR